MGITKHNQVLSLPYLGVTINNLLAALDPGHIVCLNRDKRHLAYTVWKGPLLDGIGYITFIGRAPDRLYSVLLEIDGARYDIKRQSEMFLLGRGLICRISPYWNIDYWFVEVFNNLLFDGKLYKAKRGRTRIEVSSLPCSKVIFSLTSTYQNSTHH